MVTTVTDWNPAAHTFREDDSGLYATRAFMVLGLGGTANTRLYRAMSATGIPSLGDAHPATGTLLARSITPKFHQNDNDSIEVMVDYFRAGDSGYDPDNPATSDPVIIDVDYGLRDFLSTQNATGGELGARAQIERSDVIFRVARSVTDDIEDLVASYAGKANSVAAKFDTGAATTWPVHTVRCEGFEGQIVKGRSVNRIIGVFSVAGTWDVDYGVNNWGWRFPQLENGTNNNKITGFVKIREEVNLISSGFMVS